MPVVVEQPHINVLRDVARLLKTVVAKSIPHGPRYKRQDGLVKTVLKLLPENLVRQSLSALSQEIGRGQHSSGFGAAKPQGFRHGSADSFRKSFRCISLAQPE